MQHSLNNLALESGHVCLLQVPTSHLQGHALLSLVFEEPTFASVLIQHLFNRCLRPPHCEGTWAKAVASNYHHARAVTRISETWAASLQMYASR